MRSDDAASVTRKQPSFKMARADSLVHLHVAMQLQYECCCVATGTSTTTVGSCNMDGAVRFAVVSMTTRELEIAGALCTVAGTHTNHLGIFANISAASHHQTHAAVADMLMMSTEGQHQSCTKMELSCSARMQKMYVMQA